MRKNKQKIGKRASKIGKREAKGNNSEQQKKKTRRLKKQFKQHIVNACKVTRKKTMRNKNAKKEISKVK